MKRVGGSRWAVKGAMSRSSKIATHSGSPVLSALAGLHFPKSLLSHGCSDSRFACLTYLEAARDPGHNLYGYGASQSAIH